jgi:hypothetical protein
VRLDEPRCISEKIKCPICGAQAGVPCHGIEVHPLYGPMGVHTQRLHDVITLAKGSEATA